MDESALRIALASLEDCSSSLHWWLGFWTFLVVAGVALELVFVIWEYRDDLGDFKRGFVHPPHKPSVLLFVLGFLGAGLVAVGVSGELYAESKIGTMETCIRKGNDSLFLLLSKEAGGAKDSALVASESATAAKTEANKAEAAAGNALDKSKSATGVADKAQGKADNALDNSKAANEAAGVARDKADSVARQTNELNGELLAATKLLEAVKARRAALQKALFDMATCTAPRVLESWVIGDRESSVDPLKPFAGYRAIIEYVPNDAETRRAALSLEQSLEQAKWNVSKPTPVEGIDDGVSVQPFEGPDNGSMWGAHVRSSQIADVLLDFLHSYNWQASRGYLVDEHGALIHDPKLFPPDSLRIRVGLYPPVTFVTPPGAKDLAALTIQRNQQMQESLQESEQEQLKREEKYLQSLTPQEAARFKAQRQEYDETEKLLKERYNGPCQTLNPLVPRLR